MKIIIVLILTSVLFTTYSQSDLLHPEVQELPFTTPEEAGFNQDSIDLLINLIYETPPRDFRGLVVIKDNQIVIEEYFHTFWRKSITDIRSAGKSITSLLVGAAIQDGLIENLEQNVYSFFPNDKVNKDYKKIKLKHLLDMTSGLDADTDDSSTEGHAIHWIGTDNWKDYLLNVSMTEEPGKRWVYADLHAVIPGLIIEEVSGMSLKDYATERLFKPLGINQVYWYTNASNQTGGAGNLYLTTLDFAKIGVLVANNGKWKGKQILDPDYMKELQSRETFNIYDYNSFADTYGLLWYKSHRTHSNKQYDYLWASGNGGNHLIVVPEENLVIALTSTAYGPGPGQYRSYRILGRLLNALEQ